MASELGSIDLRGRPLIRIVVAAGEFSALATIDTGFNGDVLCNLDVAIELGVLLESEEQTIELAGGVQQRAQVGSLLLVWLGRTIVVRVIVTPPSIAPLGDGEPATLLGTGLLRPHLVLFDFSEMTVEIEEQ